MTNPVAAATPFRSWTSLAAFYASTFVVLAVYMQFFPVWLRNEARFSEAEVALVLSGLTVARTFAGPFWARRVDRTGDARSVLVTLSIASAAIFALNAVAGTVGQAYAVSFAFGIFFSPMFPIVDATALRESARAGFSFARLRLVGSVTFLMAVLGVGIVLEHTGIAVVLPLLFGCLLASSLVAVRLPRSSAPVVAAPQPPWWETLRSPPFVRLLVASALIQGSHATYYNLSTVHWLDHGITKGIAGALWAEGVLAEIVLLFVAARTAERLRPTTLLLIGAGAAIVRWIVIAYSTAVPVLFAANWLHGLSFTATYFGSLRALERRVPLPQRATAQGILGAATSGVGMVVGGLVGGYCFTFGARAAFLMMAAFAALGFVLALGLRIQATKDQQLQNNSSNDSAP